MIKEPELPINMDYAPELDPEIHGFLREQQQQSSRKNRGHNQQTTQDGRGSATTHCELRLILDGLEKLGFQLVTTSSYTFQGRSHNEFIMHRELSPADLADLASVEKQKQRQPQQNSRQPRNNSSDYYGNKMERAASSPPPPSNKNKHPRGHQQQQPFYMHFTSN